MPPVVPPFLIGLVAVPLAKRFLKPLVRGVIVTSVGVVMDVKKAAHEAGESINDLAAEVAADVVATQIVSADSHRPTEGAAPDDEKDKSGERGEGPSRSPKVRAATGAGKTQ
ncbi:DUF5132 domain-containing protein [Streptomyces sp. NPDC057245]|uniref:DUF5132 domain-containing protein n=1 Tax=Streptomyces TaxID=1883 RepID=UPI001C1E04EA|nr:DUF5132 domain-containing protein [Streptomyces sp. A108]MBU6529717.1 DUF5132 domain-containing protein [Streptomyces sp. A108]